MCEKLEHLKILRIYIYIYIYLYTESEWVSELTEVEFFFVFVKKKMVNMGKLIYSFDCFILWRNGTVSIPKYPFEEINNKFYFTTNLTKKEVVWATSKVKHECNKILKMAILQTHYTRSLRLEEFEQMQTTASDQGSQHLKER